MVPRISIDRPFRSLLEALIAAAPPRLGSIDASRILVVSAAARKDAHASIRPLSFGGHPVQYESGDGRLHKPRVVMSGVEMLYEISLRPRFFLDTDPDRRASILAHELYHIDPRFDGRLAEDRRHVRSPAGALEEATLEIVEAWRSAGAVGVSAIEGPREMTLSAWRERPPSRLLDTQRERRLYTEADLYPAIVSFPN